MSRHFSSKRQRVCSSVIRRMKDYDEKCFLCVLTLYDLGVTQGQGQKCQIFTV